LAAGALRWYAKLTGEASSEDSDEWNHKLVEDQKGKVKSDLDELAGRRVEFQKIESQFFRRSKVVFPEDRNFFCNFDQKIKKARKSANRAQIKYDLMI
jgi:hypothetical protein